MTKLVKDHSTLEVMSRRCDQCLFTSRRIVDARRKAQIVADCRARDGYFSCHKAQLAGRDVCCRGFYEAEQTLVIRLAQMLDLVRFVDLEAK